FTPYGEAIRAHLDDLRRTVARKARATSSKAPFSFHGLPDLIAAVDAFQSQAQSLDRATTRLAARDGVEPARLARVTDALQKVERAFLLPSGLPGRPWFQPAAYAPGVPP